MDKLTYILCNLLFRCISQIASLFRKKRISFFIFLQLQGYKISCCKTYAIDLRTMNFRMIMLMTLSSFMVKTAVIINFICKEVEFSQLSKPSLCYHLFVWHFSMIIDFIQKFLWRFPSQKFMIKPKSILFGFIVASNAMKWPFNFNEAIKMILKGSIFLKLLRDNLRGT